MQKIKNVQSPPIMLRLNDELYSYVLSQQNIYMSLVSKCNLDIDYNLQETIRTIISQHKRSNSNEST